MLGFLKNLFPFLKKKSLSTIEVEDIKTKVEVQLSKARKNQKVIALEVDLKNKVSKILADIVLKQLEAEYSKKLGKKVSIVSKNGT